jgi:hypothetical protein
VCDSLCTFESSSELYCGTKGFVRDEVALCVRFCSRWRHLWPPPRPHHHGQRSPVCVDLLIAQRHQAGSYLLCGAPLALSVCVSLVLTPLVLVTTRPPCTRVNSSLATFSFLFSFRRCGHHKAAVRLLGPGRAGRQPDGVQWGRGAHQCVGEDGRGPPGGAARNCVGATRDGAGTRRDCGEGSSPLEQPLC